MVICLLRWKQRWEGGGGFDGRTGRYGKKCTEKGRDGERNRERNERI